MVKCSVEECKSEAFKEGWCIDHYRKMKPPGGAGAPAKGGAGGAGAGAPAKAAAPEVKAPAKAPAGGMDWQALQRMIFTRWVNQKIIARRLRINDVVTDLGTGIELVALIEVLSEKTCPKKLVQNPSMIQKLDNCSNALDFTWACGVTVELKPSAKNLLDGEPRQVLGLIWGIMRTFLKFSDDEDSKMSAPDALKMWVQNQVAGYKGVEVTNFTTSLHDGLALCALLHKFRPRLVPWETLDAKDWERNLNVAFDAAEKFFGLDKYLSAHDFRKLDDKSMVIYLSEYYYGVAAQRQKDLAARRIGKLITFTSTNDRMKNDFATRGARLKDTMERAGKLLSDRTVDNTMEGAKKRLEDFNDYKNKDKGDIINDFLSIENLLSHLSMRLAESKRPAFTPGAGLDVPGLRAALAVLEEHEKERKVALHAELNRQTKLANEAVEHKNRCEAVELWGKDKRTYIDTKEESHSVSEAEYNLNKLSAFVIESEALQKGTVQEIKKLGRELGEQKYENMTAVNALEAGSDNLFVFLNQLASLKRARLEDDLAREKEKERVLAMNQQHKEKAGQLASWQTAKKSYLEFEEKINSVREAQTALTLVRAYASERDSLIPLSVPPLLTLGENIRNAEYKGLSSWRFEHPEEVTARERTVQEGQELLAKLYSFKLARLEDDLARESHKDKLRMWNRQHADRHKKLMKWIGVQHKYLAKEEKVDSITSANTALNQLKTYEHEKVSLNTSQVKPLYELGAQIIATKYDGASKWIWDTPAEIAEREGEVAKNWEELATESATKSARLNDDLVREKVKEKVRQWNAQHVDRHRKIASWVKDSLTYLAIEEKIDTISGAELALTQLKTWEGDKKTRTGTNVKPLSDLGVQILAAEHKSDFSSWKWENAGEIKDRESWVETQWTALSDASAAKLARLEDDLAREKFNEQNRTWNANHIDRHRKISEWIGVSAAYIAVEEKVDSIQSAMLFLAKLEAYESDKKDRAKSAVAPFKAVGQDLLSADYSRLSKSKWNAPDEVKAREKFVDDKWEELARGSALKRARLDDDLAREQFKEKLRTLNAQHVDKHAALREWVTESNAYLAVVEKIASISEALLELGKLKAYEADKVVMTTNAVALLNEVGQSIVTLEHKSDLSSWKWESPGEVKDRESWVETQWKSLAEVSAAKLARLEDDLAREKFNEELRSWNRQHIDKHSGLAAWVATSQEYLAIAEKIDNISGAHEALNKLSSYEADKVDMTHAYVEPLKALGAQILKASYDHLSKSKWNTPDEVSSREEFVEKSWASLASDSATKKARLEDDLAREKFNEALRGQNAEHSEIHAVLSTWIADSIAYLRVEEKVEDISGAQVALGKLASWEADKVDEDKGAASPLREKGAAILNAEYKNLTESKWTTRDEITTREEFVASSWKQLSELSATKKDRLEDELAREEAREQWRLWNSQHIDTHARITTFVVESIEYLNKEEKVVDIGSAQLGLAQLTAYEAKKIDTTRVAVTSLKEIGARILSAEYKRLSGARWETPEEVKTRETWVDDQWITLDGLSAKKLATLKSSHELELKKENLRLTFAAQAGDFTLWATETTELAANSIFGFNLEEVERFDLKTKDAIITDAVTTKTLAWKGTFDTLTELKVTENVYTKLTPTELIAATATLNAALEVRSKRYEEEIGKRRVEDELCRAFAVLVEPFAKQIDADKDTVTKSSADLETQLADIEARIKAASAENKTLDEIKSAQARLDGAGIKNNRHTAVTARDLEAQWTQYVAFLNTKQTMLKDQIDAKKLRGVTPEQYAEIQSQFNQFDKDKSGKLDIGELRTCFYSLGNDFDKKQVDAIMTQYGTGEGKDRTISYERFKDFMIKQLGDTDTGDALLTGYDMVMRGAALGDTTQLDDCLNEEQVKYLRENAPRVATVKEGTSGSDYRAWIEASQR